MDQILELALRGKAVQIEPISASSMGYLSLIEHENRENLRTCYESNETK